jgi:hypothetical protein
MDTIGNHNGTAEGEALLKSDGGMTRLLYFIM